MSWAHPPQGFRICEICGSLVVCSGPLSKQHEAFHVQLTEVEVQMLRIVDDLGDRLEVIEKGVIPRQP